MKNWSRRGVSQHITNEGAVNTAPNFKIKKTDKGEVPVSHLEPLNKTVRWNSNEFSYVRNMKPLSRRKHRRGAPSGY